MARRKENGASGAAVARRRIGQRLQELILSGQYKPGTKLGQMELAKRFGVAQGVIRESLLELKATGLVETVDNLGVFVSQLDAKRLIQAYEIREVLEGLAARLCCDRSSREDLREMKGHAYQIYALACEDKKHEMGSRDRKFHHRLIQISGNEMLERLAESYRVLGKILRVDRDALAVRDEHLAIVDAIEKNFPDEAERLTREHIHVARRIIEQKMVDGEFVPQWVQ